jgi:hypothetical protein
LGSAWLHRKEPGSEEVLPDVYVLTRGANAGAGKLSIVFSGPAARLVEDDSHIVGISFFSLDVFHAVSI